MSQWIRQHLASFLNRHHTKLKSLHLNKFQYHSLLTRRRCTCWSSRTHRSRYWCHHRTMLMTLHCKPVYSSLFQDRIRFHPNCLFPHLDWYTNQSHHHSKRLFHHLGRTFRYSLFERYRFLVFHLHLPSLNLHSGTMYWTNCHKFRWCSLFQDQHLFRVQTMFLYFHPDQCMN